MIAQSQYPAFGNAYAATVNGVQVDYTEADEDAGLASVYVLRPDGTLDYVSLAGATNPTIRTTQLRGTVKLYETGNPTPPGSEPRPPLPDGTPPYSYENYQALVAQCGTGVFVPPESVPSNVP